MTSRANTVSIIAVKFLLLSAVVVMAIISTGCPAKPDTDNGEPPGPGPARSDVVTFTDPALDYAIRFRIEKPRGDILPSDLSDITVPRITDKEIADLEGLQYCVNLETLDLNTNSITDLGPLSGLTKLTELSLFNNLTTELSPLAGLTSLTNLSLGANAVTDIEPLGNLTSLEDLGLYRNQITDISALSNLGNLKVAGLGSNQISDLSPLASLNQLDNLGLGENLIENVTPLAGLTRLTRLSLGNNLITDITPLVENTGLGTGDEVALRNNPLSDDAAGNQIEALEARGVMVIWD